MHFSNFGGMFRLPSAIKRRPSLDFASGYGKALDEYGSDLDLVRPGTAHAHFYDRMCWFLPVLFRDAIWHPPRDVHEYHTSSCMVQFFRRQRFHSKCSKLLCLYQAKCQGARLVDG